MCSIVCYIFRHKQGRRYCTACKCAECPVIMRGRSESLHKHSQRASVEKSGIMLISVVLPYRPVSPLLMNRGACLCECLLRYRETKGSRALQTSLSQSLVCIWCQAGCKLNTILSWSVGIFLIETGSWKLDVGLHD